MGKKDKNKKKGKGAEKTAMKTDKKLAAKQKKLLEKIGEDDIVNIVATLEANEQRRTTVSETVVSPPTPRSNFSFCAHPEKEELILFGGEHYDGQKLSVYNELYFYNIPKNEWKLVMAPAGPGPRSAHQMVSVASDGGQLWLFGGEHSTPSQMQFYHYRDLWVFRIASRKWEKVVTQNSPSPRSGHRMIAHKKKLFVFGGFYDTGISYKYYNDVWIFSMESYQWQCINAKGSIVPAPRSAGCMAATQDGKILVWGGYSKTSVKKEVERGVTHSDMYALAPEKNDASGLLWKWSSVKPGGYRPAPRSGVSVAVAANGKGYIFGGVLDVNEDEENLDGQFSNEMHLLDLSNPTWRLIELKGKKDKSTKSKDKKEEEGMDTDAKATTQVSSDGVFTITVGGSSSSSQKVKSASKLEGHNAPSPRMKPGMAICKGTLYLYGGEYENGSKQYTLNDFYSLDLHKLDEWKTIIKQDLAACEWMESESEESGSESDSDDDDDDDDESDDESDDTSGMDTD
ncbi:kelch domain-containing protein 4 [Contarinia nasturtii]|uniref:kelch domain-containing protein 4 n=1 Tax=Contarinia nasturtii TaxID=265458 RepID=UPI0012D44BB2|nr:kelch domain-containing protein 4 [Contarinia nasturtii]